MLQGNNLFILFFEDCKFFILGLRARLVLNYPFIASLGPVPSSAKPAMLFISV